MSLQQSDHIIVVLNSETESYFDSMKSSFFHTGGILQQQQAKLP